ncbi:hypothetical protein DQ04_02141110 [Trypanosoma grayi]|uniref:hypothetical protein n=1 Tax=Trypanosoma grayi TaxID=71804 RepID=UPI0004F47698|nr:hypothetical protein DQ04_02141110 [Trypanosoma grayi]KEG11933.1 hypothetical protein DQ04_02141110 [Trypanosoma grayi]
MTGLTDAAAQLDAVVDAMRAAVSVLETQGDDHTGDVLKSAATFQCALHTLARTAAASSVEEEQELRRGA